MRRAGRSVPVRQAGLRLASLGGGQPGSSPGTSLPRPGLAQHWGDLRHILPPWFPRGHLERRAGGGARAQGPCLGLLEKEPHYSLCLSSGMPPPHRGAPEKCLSPEKQEVQDHGLGAATFVQVEVSAVLSPQGARRGPGR